MKKWAAGSWHSCFSLGRSPSVAKQIAAQTQEPSEAKVVAVAGKGASPAFKRLLFGSMEFMLSVCLYLLLAFKPAHNIFSSPLCFLTGSPVNSRSGADRAHPSRAFFPWVVIERQYMGTPTRSLRVSPSDTVTMEVRIHFWLHSVFVSEGRHLNYVKALSHKHSHRGKASTIFL